MQPASRPALGVPSPLLAAILFFVSGALGLTVREIAQRAIAIHQGTLRDWLDARPERERRSTLGLVISQELDAYASRRQSTRPDYVADWLQR